MSERILLSHGSGGKMSAELIRTKFLPLFENKILAALGDSAVLQVAAGRIAFTTDTFVVDPLFFPGGDIGELAINGTVNDLAVSGARPLYISVALVLEEGLEMTILDRILTSLSRAADRAGVQIVTGDTKVVPRTKVDKLFINTSGIGELYPSLDLNPNRIQPGDRLLINGAIGEHGIAVLMARENLRFSSSVISDTAPLNLLMQELTAFGDKLLFMRDPTRGGIAATLNEITDGRPWGVMLDEEKLPVPDNVKAPLEVLGMDPLVIANEGKVLLFVKQTVASEVLSAMRRHPLGREASIIGEVTAAHPGLVVLRTLIGGKRIIDSPAGELLPRIC